MRPADLYIWQMKEEELQNISQGRDEYTVCIVYCSAARAQE